MEFRHSEVDDTCSKRTYILTYKNDLPTGKLLHSFDDKPAIVCPNGHKEWYHHGLQHRENGPAVIFDNGIKNYYWYGNWYNPDSKEIVIDGICYDIKKKKDDIIIDGVEYAIVEK